MCINVPKKACTWPEVLSSWCAPSPDFALCVLPWSIVFCFFSYFSSSSSSKLFCPVHFCFKYIFVSLSGPNQEDRNHSEYLKQRKFSAMRWKKLKSQTRDGEAIQRLATAGSRHHSQAGGTKGGGDATQALGLGLPRGSRNYGRFPVRDGTKEERQQLPEIPPRTEREGEIP